VLPTALTLKEAHLEHLSLEVREALVRAASRYEFDGGTAELEVREVLVRAASRSESDGGTAGATGGVI